MYTGEHAVIYSYVKAVERNVHLTSSARADVNTCNVMQLHDSFEKYENSSTVSKARYLMNLQNNIQIKSKINSVFESSF